MRISDWSSDVCSSDLRHQDNHAHPQQKLGWKLRRGAYLLHRLRLVHRVRQQKLQHHARQSQKQQCHWKKQRHFPLHKSERFFPGRADRESVHPFPCRSEEHTSELQSLMRISYAVSCLKKKIKLRYYDYIIDKIKTQ